MYVYFISRALCDDLTLLLRQMLDTKKMKGFQMLFDVCDEIITNTVTVSSEEVI